jgi:hypothetical protein
MLPVEIWQNFSPTSYFLILGYHLNRPPRMVIPSEWRGFFFLVRNFSDSPVSNEVRNARTSHPCERGAGLLKFKEIRKPASPF